MAGTAKFSNFIPVPGFVAADAPLKKTDTVVPVSTHLVTVVDSGRSRCKAVRSLMTQLQDETQNLELMNSVTLPSQST